MVRGETDIELAPDRVCMQDATAQMAVLQFMSVGVPQVATPTSVHCDHLIRAKSGAKRPFTSERNQSRSVRFSCFCGEEIWHGFLGTGFGNYPSDFLENYAFPGGMVIGTDSHTPTGGGLGMIAIGVGGADAVDVMTKQPWTLRAPKILGVHLTGKLSGWASPKK